MPPSIPDRWLNYSPIGQRVSGTRFIAFKVPLQQHINGRVEEHLRLAPESLMESVPNLGLIIDLTNTNRYYNPSDFWSKNVEHQKLMIPGKMTPSAVLSDRFCEYVSTFLKSNKNNDKLIGVHCTHGVNRTGYMICYFMITVLKMSPQEAIKTFAAARGHEIERDNYLQSLRKLCENNAPKPLEIENWRQQVQECRDQNYDEPGNSYSQSNYTSTMTHRNRFVGNSQYQRDNSNGARGNRDRYSSNSGNYSNNGSTYNSRYSNYGHDSNTRSYGSNRNYGSNYGNNYGKNNSSDSNYGKIRNNYSNYGNNYDNNRNNDSNYGKDNSNYNNRYTSN